MPSALLLESVEDEDEDDDVGEGCDSFRTNQWGPNIVFRSYLESSFWFMRLCSPITLPWFSDKEELAFWIGLGGFLQKTEFFRQISTLSRQ